MPGQNDQQRAITAELRDILTEYVGRTGLGLLAPPKITFLLDMPGKPAVEQSPDIALLSQANANPEVTTGKVWRIAPDLAIEVASVGQKKATLTDKTHAWLRAGTKLVWIIWPEAKTVVVWRNRFTAPESLTSGDIMEDEAILPGFSLLVADLF